MANLLARSGFTARLSAAFGNDALLAQILGSAQVPDFTARLSAAFGNDALLAQTLGSEQVPDDLLKWLNRLMLLHGVPLNYLLPDEKMLPPESIRFFYVDLNWIEALIDGAFSIGRNLTADGATASQQVDRAVAPAMLSQVRSNAGAIRAKAFGIPTPPVTLNVVSGFLLRSSAVRRYPGIDVNAYPKGGTPNDPQTVILKLLRLEQLGPESDTLLCLVDGDIYQVDVHEPPEQLHYGIDEYTRDTTSGSITANKKIRKFTRSGDDVQLSNDFVQLDLKSSFRTSSPRTVIMTRLAAAIAQANGIASVDSADMGFEMTEGVGQVSFVRRNS
jgi:hypothetical protein